LGLLLLCWFFLSESALGQQRHQTQTPYLIGRGMVDITGPPVGMPLWGFGRPDQISEGIHIRQRSRAFIIVQANDEAQRLIFVSADLGSIDHHMTLEVVERLQQRYGKAYTLDNVIISATHTHAGPSGYWQSRTDTGLDGGHYPEHFDAIVTGITESIVQAHDDLQPGNILINTGRVADAGVNRSAIAYQENPQSERDRYGENTNTAMTLLKFVGNDGALGMINWYALHPTAMNYYNRLISGDHKGYASLQMEKSEGTRYTSTDDFVAAFAQSDPGDVTPNTNLDNTGPGETDVETTRIMGQRQLVVAQTLFDEAEEALTGAIDARRLYVDFSDYAVGGDFTGAGTQTTCPSAYGYSFAGGSTEDGGGHFLFREGMTEQSVWRDWLIRLIIGAPEWSEPVKTCQRPKAILLETGTGSPPLQSQIRSITVARIGQLILLAIPAEVTTMAGRRLRDTVMRELGDWAEHIVLAGYSNGYAGYITTPEEYGLQQYEGGHTLHGRWTLPAYQQIVSQLAQALESGAPVANDLPYDDWRGQSVGLPLPCERHQATTRWRGAGRCSDPNGRSVSSGRDGDGAVLVGEPHGKFPQAEQLPFG
jgi:neutral ceramidase